MAPELEDGIRVFAGPGEELSIHDASELGGVTSEKATEWYDRSWTADIEMRDG